MENYQVKEEKIESKDYKYKFGNSTYFFETYKDRRKHPRIYNMLATPKTMTDEEFFDEIKIEISLIITELTENPNLFNSDKFIKSEFLKVLLKLIKIELCYSKKSTLLEFLIKENYNIELLKSLIKKEIEGFYASSFGNPELTEYLNRNISIYNDFLSPSIIRALVMCTDYELIRKGNLHILNEYKEELENLSFSENRKEKIVKNSLKFLKEKSKNATTLNIRKRFCASALAILIGFGGTGIVKTFLSLNDSKVTTYKTIHETYTSLGDKEIIEEYLSLIINNTPKLKIYGETYEKDGIFYKDVTTYKINDFSETTDLSKYYDIDFNLLPIEPEEITTEIVSEKDYLEEYKVIEKYTQDESDTKEIIRERELSEKILSNILAFLISILEVVAVVCFGLPTLLSFFKVKDQYIYTKKLCKEKTDSIKELIEDCLSLLKKSGLTIEDAIKLCDEIAYSQDLNDLDEEYLRVINTYKTLKEQNQALIESLNKTSDDKIIKKYEK